MSEKLDKALSFATEAHKGQTRKMDKIPFILHPMEAAVIAGSLTTDEDIIVAAVLHDTVEDTEATIEDIRERFGETVAKYVAGDTENKRDDKPKSETWKIRKEESLEILKNTNDINIKILWLSDKLSNMRSLYRTYIKIGDKAFDYFNQKDKGEQAWYYRTIAAYLEELCDTAVYKEYVALINFIFS